MAVVCSALIVSAGLLVGCELPVKGSKDEQPDLPVLEMPEAYYTLTASDMRSIYWPESWKSFDLFVCNASIQANQLAQARADRPDAVFLAYTSVADIHLGMYSQDPYWAALEAVFDTTLCVRDLWRDVVVRMSGSTDDPASGIPYYVIQEQSADILVQFHRDVTMARGFDGLYLDNCTAAVPPYRLSELFAMTPRADVDGDGEPDTADAITQLYATWRPYYTQRLREELGENVILLANAGGRLGDAVLNGITLEGVGDRFQVVDAKNWYDEQRMVGRLPFLGVAWVTTPASEGPTLDLVPQMDGLHYGYLAP